MDAQATVSHLLSLADIEIGGPNPWDIRVNEPRWFGRVLRGGSLALGESFRVWAAGHLVSGIFDP
jgi:cyclopropane-fatty-acyl-phospholipid synthase